MQTGTELREEGGIISGVRKKDKEYSLGNEPLLKEGGYRNPVIKVLPPGEAILEITLICDLVKYGVSAWNFPGKEGMRTKVIVQADDCEVELFINGEVFGKKMVDENTDFIAIFEVLYQPGLIEVISYHNNLEYGRAVLK